MTGPDLRGRDPIDEHGLAPPRLRRWLSNVPKDFKTVIDWVIQNFQPLAEGGVASGTACLRRLCPPPTTGTHVAGVITGVVQWIDTTQCQCSKIDGGSA